MRPWGITVRLFIWVSIATATVPNVLAIPASLGNPARPAQPATSTP